MRSAQCKSDAGAPIRLKRRRCAWTRTAAGTGPARASRPDPAGSNSYVATITAYIGSLGASVPLKLAE